jgi:hypothetical protein
MAPAVRACDRDPRRRSGLLTARRGAVDGGARGGLRAGEPLGTRRARQGAAGCLLDLFRSLRAAGRGRSREGLLAVLAQHAERAGQADADAAVANGIGLLSQAYEATAGLIGNALVTLAAHPPVRAEVASDPGLLPHVIQEVLRFDSPVQNTRRFLAGAATIAGQAMDEGGSVLVVLAAANRDPSANPDPDRFAPPPRRPAGLQLRGRRARRPRSGAGHRNRGRRRRRAPAAGHRSRASGGAGDLSPLGQRPDPDPRGIMRIPGDPPGDREISRGRPHPALRACGGRVPSAHCRPATTGVEAARPIRIL